MAYPLPWGERVRVRGNMFVHPSPSQRLSEPAATLILPHPRHNSAGSSTRGRKVF